ncbi:MAG: hypothetical protein RL318_1937 [Fibrobacterota bacterium]
MTQVYSFDSSYAEEYIRKSRGMIPGYGTLFELARTWLSRRLGEGPARVLLVGGGGGMEIESFAPASPDWSFHVVDPAVRMAQAAGERAQALEVADRVEVTVGTVDTLPAEARYGAATCILVGHFLSKDAQGALLRDIAARLVPGAPLVLVQLFRPEGDEVLDELLECWRQRLLDLGEDPAEVQTRFAAREREITLLTEVELAHLLAESGFSAPLRFHQALLFGGWFMTR